MSSNDHAINNLDLNSSVVTDKDNLFSSMPYVGERKCSARQTAYTFQ